MTAETAVKRRYQLDWYYRKVAAGLCGTCGQAPVETGRRRCAVCTERRKAQRKWRKAYRARAQTEDVNRSIMVVGLSTKEDLFTLTWIAEWLRTYRAQKDWCEALLTHHYDAYDMTTMPEKGDALDALGDGVELVIALHLFGIDKMPGGNTAAATALSPAFCYNRENVYLLERCLKIGAPLVAVGDQPWLGIQKRTIMHGFAPEIVLYERSLT